MHQLRSYVGHVNPLQDLRSPLKIQDVVLTGRTNTIERVPRWNPAPEQVATADRLIELLGLSNRQRARWPTLSQRERGPALISRALMPSPKLLRDTIAQTTPASTRHPVDSG
ncbi:hypothetical protein OG426_37825 [Streptomyces canus]|uniref:hypothetical protein n=1 Tax=Streptomyces canus TaxID=58343 RepID=UPI002256369D|nr:hypothetical protein [Streptomyces canus]MCX4856811.1 hypothetical protein [Streptomyces canus]WSW37800.1 hypothetical protein OG426_37825 [Streptomyces canus]